MKKISLIFSVTLLLIGILGCQSQVGTEEKSKAILLNIDGEVFVGQKIVTGGKFKISDLSEALIEHTNIEDKKVTVGEKIGTVQLKEDKYPEQSLRSNYFDVGTEIYNLNENEDILLAKTGDDEYHALLGNYDKDKYN